MKTNSNHGWAIALIALLLTLACTLSASTSQPSTEPTLSAQDIAATAVSIALTSQASSNGVQPSQPPPPLTEAAATLPTATAIPSATQCVATVTATTNANVRSGPDTAYDVVGYLPTGGIAQVSGQNDARTWWYIQFAGGPGGYAWIAGSVTSATCIPPVLQIVVAPPLPTAVPATFTPTLVAMPDLYVSEYSWSPVPPHMGVSFHVRIGVYNQGNAATTAFVVEWWLTTTGPAPTCTWEVASLVAHGGRILECDYTTGGWSNYPSAVYVDVGNHVAEIDETNNTRTATLKISP
ncbi:MAG TPA: CARDB domain-containing protein [Anaerolineales bacterium]|nr:CARDB domain-containing protein [Anaerolineales bacterium]